MKRSRYVGLLAMAFMASFIIVSQSVGQDPTKIAPQSYNLVLENDSIRVLTHR